VYAPGPGEAARGDATPGPVRRPFAPAAPEPRSEPSRAPRRPSLAALPAVLVAVVPVAAVVLFGAVEGEHALPIEALALLMGAAAVAARARRGDRPLPFPAVTLPVLLLAALPAVQLLPIPAGSGAWVAPGLGRFGLLHLTTLSVQPYATFLALVRWASYAAFLIAALEVLGRPGAPRAALAVMAALGVLEALYGVGNLLLGNARLLWLPRIAYAGDATGTLVNRNHFGTAMVLCLSALLAVRWLAPHRRRADERALTVLALAGATAIGLGTVLSHSRGGMVCLVAALAVAAALAPHDSEGRGGRRIVAAVVGLVLVYGAYVGLGPVAERFGEIGERPQAGRVELWRDTVRVFRDFPLAGAGAGTFETVFPAYRRPAGEYVPYAHAHQDYLELAAEGGIVALALAAAAAVAFAAALRAGFARLAGRRRLALAALTAGLAASLLHAAADFPLHIPGIVFLVLLAAAAAIRLAAEPEAGALRDRRPGRGRRAPLRRGAAAR
jgi:O-antigen ligase